MPTERGYECWITVDFGIDTLGDQPEQRFTGIEYKRLPSHVRSESKFFLQHFLQPEALPSRAAKADVRYFRSVNENEKDLVEFRWDFDGKLLRYVENINAAKIEIPLGDILDEKKAEALVSSIVKLSAQDQFSAEEPTSDLHSTNNSAVQKPKFYQIKLKWPVQLTNGIQFSSDANQFPFNMGVWYDRVDAFVLNGKLSIIFYKRRWYAANPGFLAANKWFVLPKLQGTR